MNISDMTGFIIPNREVMTVVSMTNATAAPAPMSRFFAKSMVLLRFPLGLKVCEGVMLSVMPVNALSNSSGPTLTKPLAGSFMQAYFPLKPSSTTK